MKFNVELTEQADKDLRSIYLYISVDLNSPENAIKQIKRLWNAILSLDELPQRYRRYEDEPWHSRGIRVLPVDNFVINLWRKTHTLACGMKATFHLIYT